MRITSLSIALFLSIPAACAGDIKSSEAITALPAKMDLSGYSKVHEFRSTNEGVFARLYGKSAAPDVFSTLLFVNESGSSTRIIYLLDRDRFLGARGVDIEPDSSNFYGYAIVLKASDHVVVNYLSRGGRGVSDDMTIRWNFELKEFELMKTP